MCITLFVEIFVVLYYIVNEFSSIYMWEVLIFEKELIIKNCIVESILKYIMKYYYVIYKMVFYRN